MFVCVPGNALSLDFQNSLVSKPDAPPPQSKPTALRAPGRDDAAQATFHPQRSFPDRAPAGAAEQAPRTGAPAYSRFTPKPYTAAARPFERKFDSPKFSHNLLPSEATHKPDVSSKTPTSPKMLGKAHGSAQPLEFDSGVETFSVRAEKPRYQANNVSSVPRAVPVR